MKKYLLFFAVLVMVAVMAVSCGKNTPKDVASTWLNGFYHMDYEAAKKVSTEDTKNMLTQIQQLAGTVNDSMKKEMRKIQVEIRKVDVKGDTAKVTYRLADQPGRDMPLDVVKINDKWLVLFTKSSRMPEPSQEETPAAEADTTGAATTPPDHTTAEDTTKN